MYGQKKWENGKKFTCAFITFSNINEENEYFALKGVVFVYINNSNILHSSNAVYCSFI